MARTNAQNLPQQPGGGAQPPAKPARVGYDRIKELLVKQVPKYAEVLPRHMDAAKLVGVAANLVWENEELQKCEPHTVLSAVHQVASLGLSLDKRLAEAWLIPRWNGKLRYKECQFQVGYQGLRKLSLQSGAVSYIQSRLVFERDVFRYRFTPDLDFLHEPYLAADRGPVTHAYCVAKLMTGDKLIECMAAEEIEKSRLRARESMRRQDGTYPTTPWDTDWNEMAKKTPLRRLCKSLPRSTELDMALSFDDAPYDGMETRVVASASPFGGRQVAGRPGRGLAAIGHGRGRAEAQTEPEFDAGQGVERPLYVEPPEADPDPDDLPQARMPGED